MKRWHQEEALMKGRQTFDYRWPLHGRAWPKGRYRKRKPLDCGKTQCLLCHSDKFPKRSASLAEIKADIDFKEQIDEL